MVPFFVVCLIETTFFRFTNPVPEKSVQYNQTMSNRDYYSILGVTPDAPASDIRKAYVRISRIVHPDRFDPATQPEDWEQANRMLREVNEAWQTLKDPSKRSFYDMRMGFRSNAGRAREPYTYKYEAERPAQKQKSEQEPPGEDPTTGIRPGSSPFNKLPENLQETLLKREKDILRDHYRVDTDRPHLHYLKAGIFPVWLSILFFSSLGSEWSLLASLMMLVLTVVITLYASGHIFWLLRWHSAPLSCRVYITPLYVIETFLDEVRWWPVTGIREARITNENARYATSKTMLSLVYRDSTARFEIAPVQLARNCVRTLRKFQLQAENAVRTNNTSYFDSRNEFAEVDGRPFPHRKGLQFSTYGVLLLTGLMAFGAIFSSNRGNEPQIGSRLISQMLPLHGSNITYFNKDLALAPLELEATGFRHYLVKITHYETGTPVKTVFIRSNRKKHVRLPDGVYRIRYAGGYNWYGPDDLFGPNGRYFIETEPFAFSSEGNRLQGYLIRLGDESRVERGEVLLTVPESF